MSHLPFSNSLGRTDLPRDDHGPQATGPQPLRELDSATIIVARRMLTALKGVSLERADMAASALLAAIRTQPVEVEGDTVSIRVMDDLLRAMEPAA